jgi:hypothetical protein
LEEFGDMNNFLHWLFGCHGTKSLGKGWGLLDEKKNHEPMITKKMHEFFECVICGDPVMKI